MKIEDIRTVSVIGAGDMGHGIAENALLGGFEVFLQDLNSENLDKGVRRIYDSLEIMRSKGKISDETVENCKKNLHPTLDFHEAATKAQFIIEAVSEVLDIKQKLFKDLDEITAKDTILATNTSSMTIAHISEYCRHKERVVGLHFFNPVVIIPLVEVIKGNKTSIEVMQTAYDLCIKMNKHPIRIEKDSPGFIINRVNSPVRTLMGAIVDRGLAEPEEIDALLRFHGLPIGHFELSDHIGLDVIHDAAQYRKKVLHPEFGPYETLLKKVKLNQLGKKTGKGFYDWSNGKPFIDLTKRTNVINIEDLDFIRVNEAMKLIEEEVTTKEDIDLAFKLTGDKKGPFELVEPFDLRDVINRLEYFSQKFEKEVFKPTKLLRESV